MKSNVSPRFSWQLAALVALFMAVLVIFLKAFYPLGVDWTYNFAPLSGHWRNPFIFDTFTSPPWIIALIPHAWLPVAWGNPLNFALNLILIVAVVHRYRGGWQTLLLVFTSPPFFDLARTNNVDWLPMLALLLPPAWGLPVLAVKPQALGGAALIWWKRQNFRWQMLVPFLTVLALSFVVWGFWPTKLGLPQAVVWNFAPWPVGIPLGVYMLRRAYLQDDEILAAAATPFLVPYIAPYSVTALLAMAGGKYRKEAFIVYVAFWVYVIVESRRIALM